MSRRVSCPCGTLSRADSWVCSGLLPAPASLQLWHPLSHSSLFTTHQFPGCSWSPLLWPIQWLASLAWAKTPHWRTVLAGHDESIGGMGRSDKPKRGVWGSKPRGRAERERVQGSTPPWFCLLGWWGAGGRPQTSGIEKIWAVHSRTGTGGPCEGEVSQRQFPSDKLAR